MDAPIWGHSVPRLSSMKMESIERIIGPKQIKTKDLRHKSLLNKLADQYETVDFLQGDPAWFMHQVVGKRNQETMAFIASCLSYGARKAFLPRIQHLLDCSHAEPYEWISKENTDWIYLMMTDATIVYTQTV